jgi:hypothetical protein
MEKDDRDTGEAAERRRRYDEGGIDSADRLTGGYGGDPEADEELDRTAGSAAPDDVGSTSPDSGMTAGGTDTSVDPELVNPQEQE